MNTKKLPVTVMIPTLNAAAHLEELVASIQDVVEDIFLVDSRSVDNTIDLALKMNLKVIQRPFKNFGDQYDWMVHHLPVKTPWIFFMAQDERFSDSLVAEMHRVLDNDPTEAGFQVKWRLWFMGKPLHARVDNLRLLRTGKCACTNVVANEHFLVDGSIGTLNGDLEHKDTLTMYEWYEKQNLYTTMEAINRIQNDCEAEKPTLFGTRLQRKKFFKRLFIRMPGGSVVMFFFYFLKYGAWKDGLDGITWAKLRVWVHNTCTLKEKEMRRNGKIPKLPEARRGDFDKRIMHSQLQMELLPELTGEWLENHQ